MKIKNKPLAYQNLGKGGEKMRQNLLKNLAALSMALMLIFPVFSLVAISDVSAQTQNPIQENDLWGGDKRAGIKAHIGLSDSDPRLIVAQIIRVTLGFLGIIAVVIVLVGGFKWMTAFGNEEKVTEAKKLMFAGVIGLVIVLASFGIATFVITSVFGAVNSGDGASKLNTFNLNVNDAF